MSGERDRKTAVEGPRELLGPGGMHDAATAGHREDRPDREAAPAGGEKRPIQVCERGIHSIVPTAPLTP
jgi:hypothetical protein